MLTVILLPLRTIQTESLPPSANESILNQQRLKRPTSPHLTIYQPQLTWVMSIANRAAGVGLSVRMFIFLIQCFFFFWESGIDLISILKRVVISSVRILDGILNRTRNIRQCACCRICSRTSRWSEVPRENHPCFTFRIPFV